MPASPAAKIKTTLQLAAITLYILPLGSSWHGLRFGLLMAAIVFTLVTGIHYAVRAMPWLRRVRPDPPVKPGSAA
jgi:CDP-diacylglycerol--glycerol-3-phosphate 3-phosphatidyltransferase